MERDRLTNCRWVREPDALSERPERWRDCGWCGGQRVYAEPVRTSEGSVYVLVICPRCLGVGSELR